jgi:hypothetical protein
MPPPLMQKGGRAVALDVLHQPPGVDLRLVALAQVDEQHAVGTGKPV